MVTREVAAVSCANAVNRLNPTIFNTLATTTCARGLQCAINRLRPLKPAIINNTAAPMPAVHARMLNGGISNSANFMTGHVTPQLTLNTTSIKVAVVASLSLDFVATKGTFRK